MQYSFFALAAAIGAVHAQSDVTADSAQLLSVVSVLQTALPSSLIQDALTNSAGVASELVSQFADGETPSWFTALPTDVQTYLLPSGAGGVANATVISTTSAASATGTGGFIGGAGNNGTVSNGTTTSSSSVTLVRTSTRVQTTLTEGPTGSSSSTEGSSSSSSEAGAGVPTAAVAMGFAGLAGVVGVLAL